VLIWYFILDGVNLKSVIKGENKPCSASKTLSFHSELRNSGVFESIAEETGGSIYHTNSDEMGEIIINEIEVYYEEQ
jgi:hypothetical protein